MDARTYDVLLAKLWKALLDALSRLAHDVIDIFASTARAIVDEIYAEAIAAV